jgi:3-methyladenine DNA glycosylase AlkD
LANSKKAGELMRFFKTGKGEYAEGDKFYGIMVPITRKLVSKYKGLEFADVEKLLSDEYHEVRLLALFMLVEKFKKADEKVREKIVKIYLRNTKYINNWDLVDLSAKNTLGWYYLDKSPVKLISLAKSKDLWEKRIAVLSTFYFIGKKRYDTSLEIAEILLHDKHDLIHKAVGWMLREVGNKSLETEENFLKKYYGEMPRTMLRYAIEKFPESRRKEYLSGMIKT